MFRRYSHIPEDLRKVFKEFQEYARVKQMIITNSPSGSNIPSLDRNFNDNNDYYIQMFQDQVLDTVDKD